MRPIRISLVFLCSVLLTAAFAQSTTVKISNGYIKGVSEDQSIVFKGIPYAKPPVGQLRFKAPVPAADWKDTLSCTKFGNVASQAAGKGVKGDEDCLSLNVYTPVTDKKAKLPVVVWVHGGAMTAGSGSAQNGHAFADRDSIVTVTINYRLGVFGFMYLGDVDPAYCTSGNNGVQDLIMALKWIKKNIKSFGGDPSRVTVMGESAGAKLVSTLLVTSKAKGYFSQLVLESGAVQCIRDSTTAKVIRQRVMKELNIEKPSELLNLPMEKLIDAQNKVCNGAMGTNYFGPVEDGDVITSDAYQYIQKHKDKHTRFLIGTNKEESKLFMNGDKGLFKPDSAVLADWFGENYPQVLANYKTVAAQVSPDSAAIRVLTQYMYQMHSYRLADTLAKVGNDVWMYRFDYTKEGIGATHAQELQYLWYVPGSRNQFNDTGLQLAAQMHKAWVNFIKGQQPGDINGASWPLYKTDRPVVIFDNAPHLTTLPGIFNDTAYPTAGFILK